MQYKLSHLPLVKIILPFIAGIFVFDRLAVSFVIILSVAAVLFGLLIISHLTIENISYKKLNAIIIYCLVFIVGGLMIQHKKLVHQPAHFSNHKSEFIKGVIDQPLEEKDKTFKTVIRVSQLIDSNQHRQSASGKLLCYIQKDSILNGLEIGDEVIFHSNYKFVDVAKNPGQFDYKNYLAYKSIFHQQYIKAGEICILHKHADLFIKRISNNIGVYVQSILKKYIPKQENFALADGILLGHRANIDIELYNDFAYIGTLHILSVSGLHVGIIYGMLIFFLSIIKDKNKQIKIAKFVFITLFIWMFAFVTGFSAACVRAAILFTLLNYGKLNKEHVSNVNILSGAALLQLLIDPNNLFDIGFQLSYLAMLGLFIFYKPIYALFYHPNKIVDWTWQLWSASIAAQLFTVPLSIYYFGNFPTYFLIANIFAIPLSTVILWLGVLLIPFSFVPFLAKITGWLNSLVITVFIKLTYIVSELPLGKLYNLYISKLQLVLLLIAISCLTFYIIRRKAKFVLACLSLFLITIFISYAYAIQQLKQAQIVLYSVPKNMVIGINNNTHQLLFTKDSLQENTFSFCIKNSYRKYRIDEHQTYILNDSASNSHFYADSNLLFANGKSFYFLRKDNNRKQFSPALKIDYLLLTDNCYLDIGKLKSDFEYSQLILSTDNDYRHVSIYKKLLKENNLKYVDLNEQAFVIQP